LSCDSQLAASLTLSTTLIAIVRIPLMILWLH
jgi:hypothetical protein